MPSIYYFCRGNGFGHASRALAILESLSSAQDVTMFSGTSATAHLRRAGVATTDLGWTDATDHGAAAVRAVTEVLARRPRPDVVIADELHYVPLICANLAIPVILLSCRLGTEAGGPEFDIACAQSGIPFIIPDWEDCHEIPDHLVGIAEFPGPLVREIRQTRGEARAELAVPPQDFLCVLAFGALHPNKKELQAELLRAALGLWQEHGEGLGQLAILCGKQEATQLIGEVITPAGVRWIGYTPDAATFYRAADVVMCTAGTTSLELARNGVPCVVFPGSADDVARKRSAKLHDAGLAHVVTGPVPAESRVLLDDLRAAQALAPSADANLIDWCPADLVLRRVMTTLERAASLGA
ncbi:glycosyltransferase [Amycolatopsis magusensis]|uniref:glycosyltransferase n=1 Tax=Amycolatopsis magusensis TaxID=882444 RepID=UPI003793A60D